MNRSHGYCRPARWLVRIIKLFSGEAYGGGTANGPSPHPGRDAGLPDTTLPDRHAAFIRALGRHLDTQAGLAAICPPPAA